MAITSSGSVLIQLPTDAAHGEAMSRFREWLDAHKIEPVLFKSSTLRDGSTVIEIGFRASSDATRFNSEFG